MDTIHFWEKRAAEYAAEGAGLRAVCSYAMPNFYNWAIDVTQRAALDRVIRSINPRDEVLDYGCGVGRWTRELARRGARVTAVDFSANMLAEARRRTAEAGLSDACTFVRSDVCEMQPTQTFDVIFGVTVLQHVLDEERLAATIARFARHLRPGGRLILLEAAPTAARASCDTRTFRARTLGDYVAKIQAAGLHVAEVRGVDPASPKLWVIPRFHRWPRPVALYALALATCVSLPFDLLFAKLLTRRSWHKLIVAVAPGGRHERR